VFAAAAGGELRRGGGGDAGIGKSSTLRRFVADLHVPAHLQRRLCARQGNTFRPIIDIIRTAVGFDASYVVERIRAEVAAAVGDEAQVAVRLWSLLGVESRQFPVGELFWAVRRLVERLAATAPVIMVIDGYQWAESTLGDLLGSLAETLPGGRVMIIVQSRAEVDASAFDEVITLGGLSEEEADTLIQSYLGGGAIPKDLAEQLRSSAAGNPCSLSRCWSARRRRSPPPRG
jgi:predicted ATPase